ncbi:phage terminase small subunit [Enterovibrio norvegicus]|uniref:phage terminase small subunit n=1 Tax=Enterovibrio norvegicus TaxID=188144 RepID=UPI000C836E42|nr:phage terminase small subunit [Enterovibrio norvegicus]PMN68405.1 terminase [Enterovibrio norvegicus]
MVSPIRAMREKMKADRNSAGETLPVIAASPDTLELRLIELEADRQTLKSFNAIADKIEHKRTVLMPKYRPVAEAYLVGSTTYENPIFSEVVLWLFDIGELDTFIEWCLKAIELNVPTPERIKRDWQTFCADSIHQWATEQVKNGQSVEPYFSQVFERIQSDEWRLHEKVSAKFYKLAGQNLLRGEDGTVKATHVGDVETLTAALELLEKADQLDSKAQVSDLTKNRIPARIKALTDGTNL